MRLTLLSIAMTTTLLMGCRSQVPSKTGFEFQHWYDQRVDFSELTDKGYRAEYENLNGDNPNKHEIIVYLPSHWFDDDELALSSCLFIDQNAALDLQWHEREGEPRVILTVSDEVLKHAKLFVAYSPAGKPYGRRHVFNLSSVVSAVED